MTETTAGTVPAAWRDSVRGFVDTAWDALDRAQIFLYKQYQDTQDEQVATFKRRFDRAVDALIGMAYEELGPADDQDANETDADH